MSENTSNIDKKAIRVFIQRQLAAEHPHFSQLKRKAKREIVSAACKSAEKAMKAKELKIPALTDEILLGLGKIPEGIMSLEEMTLFIKDHERSVLPFPRTFDRKHIKKPLLKCMNEILDNGLLDRLLAPPGMTPSKRMWMPSKLLRIELLRTSCFPELSVRKFCDELRDLNRKEERTFCHLSLRKKGMCDHSTLSEFRSTLTFEMRVNLMVFMAHHFLSAKHVDENCIHMIDSTDVAEPINSAPLAKLKMPDGSFIRFYSDLSSDCGSRRNKRDKSKMFVGYRVHTLCVADARRGIAFPLLSIALAANHHDSQTLDPILSLAEAMGLDVKVLSADEAYADAEKQKRILNEQGTIIVTPPKQKTKIPECVASENGSVFIDKYCETPMIWDGYDKDAGSHVFYCGNDDNICPRKALCPKERKIALDTGFFGPIPFCSPGAEQAINIRKITERPFNLLKHMDGLEPSRMKTFATVSAQVVFSQMTGLFKVMAGLRALPATENKKQEVLPIAANG